MNEVHSTICGVSNFMNVQNSHSHCIIKFIIILRNFMIITSENDSVDNSSWRV